MWLLVGGFGNNYPRHDIRRVFLSMPFERNLFVRISRAQSIHYVEMSGYLSCAGFLSCFFLVVVVFTLTDTKVLGVGTNRFY